MFSWYACIYANLQKLKLVWCVIRLSLSDLQLSKLLPTDTNLLYTLSIYVLPIYHGLVTAILSYLYIYLTFSKQIICSHRKWVTFLHKFAFLKSLSQSAELLAPFAPSGKILMANLLSLYNYISKTSPWRKI